MVVSVCLNLEAEMRDPLSWTLATMGAPFKIRKEKKQEECGVPYMAGPGTHLE